MSIETIGWLAALVLAYGTISRLVERWWLTVPIVFMLLGLALGPAGAGVVSLDVDGETLRVLAEATLLLILFTDAARIDVRALRLSYRLPVRLLGLGLPLTVAAGGLLARALLPALDWVHAFLVGAILAPTDAALGQAVVDDQRVPQRVRQSLNTESGLNDGLALPLVTAFAALAAAEAAGRGVPDWAGFALRQIVLGGLVGAVVGAGSATVIDAAARRGWMEGTFRQLATFTVPVLALVLADLSGGNGFIAAFAAGLVFGQLTPQHCTGVTDFAADEGYLLEIIVFFAFGATLLGGELAGLEPALVAYAVLSLTVVRMVPVALSLLGSGVRGVTMLFMGWFGPRGLASILFLLLVVERAVPAAGTVQQVVTLTVALSVLTHGLSARPLAAAYARSLSGRDRTEEEQPMPASPSRRGRQ